MTRRRNKKAGPCLAADPAAGERMVETISPRVINDYTPTPENVNIPINKPCATPLLGAMWRRHLADIKQLEVQAEKMQLSSVALALAILYGQHVSALLGLELRMGKTT